MAQNHVKGEGRAAHRGFLGSPAHLPPKIPPFASIGVSSSDLGTGLYSRQNSLRLRGSQRQHQRTPSCSFLMQEQPSWLDDLLDDSDVPSKKGSHRRCASDSFTYLESSGGLYTISNIAEEEEFDGNDVLIPSSQDCALEHLDGDQLTVLLKEIQQLQKQQNVPISVRTQPSVISFDSRTTNKNGALSLIVTDPSYSNSTTSMVRSSIKVVPGQLGSGPEGETFEDEEFSSTVADSMCPAEGNLEPKPAKRQSAQRSRVRKLQYIAELERIVNNLQTEVSMLSPQVTYLEHQHVRLDMDNSALKQRIAICMREKKLKDSHNEILKKEVQRLQKLHQFQLLHQEQKEREQQSQHHLQRHSSLPSDFGLQTQRYSQLNFGYQQANSDTSLSDSLTGLMENLAGVSLDAGSSNESVNNSGRLNGLRAVLPSNCTVGVGGKLSEGRH